MLTLTLVPLEHECSSLSLSLLGVTAICYSHLEGFLMEVFFLLCLLPLHTNTSQDPHSQQSGKYYYNLNESYELSTWWTPLILTQPYRLSSSFSIWGNWGWESKQKPSTLALCTTEIPSLTPGTATAPHPSGLEIKGRVSGCWDGAGHSLHLPPLWKVLRTPWKYPVVLSGSPALGPPTSQPHLWRRSSTQKKKNQYPWGSLPPSLGGPARVPLNPKCTDLY